MMKAVGRIFSVLLALFALYGAVRMKSDITARRAANRAIVELDAWDNRLLLRLPMDIDPAYVRVDSVRLATYFGCACELELEKTTRETAILITGRYMTGSPPRMICTTIYDTIYPAR